MPPTRIPVTERLGFFPAGDHKPGDLCEVYHYENGKLMGTIPEVAHTFSVVQFMNEHQVAIGETTFGGLDSLTTQPGAILDYGSLMRIGLQRSKTAREMIKVMTELVAQYGYATSGESFSISDANEAWIMEIIGKGKYEKGAVWVAPSNSGWLCERPCQPGPDYHFPISESQ